jgi:hypothetical protein
VKLLLLLAYKHAYNCYGFLDERKNRKREKDANIKGYFRQQENKSYGFCATPCGFDTHATTGIHTMDRDVLRLVKPSCGLFMHS